MATENFQLAINVTVLASVLLRAVLFSCRIGRSGHFSDICFMLQVSLQPLEFRKVDQKAEKLISVLQQAAGSEAWQMRAAGGLRLLISA